MSFSAAELVRLLADDDRRAVVAALVLGATARDDARARTGLEARPFAVALARLLDSGLVIEGGDGTLVLLAVAFREAARAEAPPPAPGVDHPDPEAAKVLRAFVRDGRITAIPTQHAKRLVLLDLLAQEFEPGKRYSEKMVNLLLGRWHADTAAWRRYLVDDGFLDREGGQYWRSGGSVPPA